MRSLELAREEALHLLRKPIMVAAVIVMMMIPLLYGALYLWAFWDPYGALDRIPIALVNLDQSAEADGKTISAGSDLVERLLDTGTFDWHVVSAEEAKRGVREGAYYSSLTIPRDFSAALANADSDAPAKARLHVILHESKNMIAAQIEGKVYGEVRKAASTSASKDYFDAVLLGFDGIRVGLGDAADGSAQLAEGLDVAADGSTRLKDGAGDARDGAAELSSGLGKLSAGASMLASGTRTAARGTQALAAGAASMSDGTGSLAAGAGELAAGTTRLATGLSTLESGTASLSSSAKTLADGAAQVDDGVSYANTQLGTAAQGAADLSEGSAGVASLLAAIAAKYPDTAADPLFQKARATAGVVASGTAELADGLRGASTSADTLSVGAHRVAAGGRLLAAGASSVSSATVQAAAGARLLAEGADRLSSGTADAEAGAAKLAAGADEAASGVADLSDGSGTLAVKLHEADAGAGALAAGLTALHDGTADLANGLADARAGSRELAHGLRRGANDVPSYSKEGRTARADMMSDPVALDETKLGEVKTYGAGFAPYFVPLALWVGMLIVFVLLAPVPERAARSKAKAPVVAMTGMWPAIAVGCGQSLLMYLALRFGLGLDPVHPVATLGLILLTAIVYAAIMQWLGAAFGAIGKLLGIVILMLQLTSAAGTFPIETLPGFFQAISPLMPMTHVVAALREAVSGGDVVAMLREAWTVALFGAAAFAGTVLSVRSAHTWSPRRLKPTIEL